MKVTGTRRWKNRRWRLAALIVFAFPGALGLWAAVMGITGNIHVVERGAFYRSGQLGPQQLAKTIEEYGIRTVINLRGANPGKKWYDGEIATCRRLHIVHLDVGMSADNVPGREMIAQLIRYMRESSKPILAHCEGGADRAGLASALYLLVLRHEKPGEAATELSFRYGHIPWLFPGSAAMDKAFRRESQFILARRDIGGSGRKLH
ncbi:MAG: tyrosine-protein phosphatase [Syntrophobacteraceae bacterium]